MTTAAHAYTSRFINSAPAGQQAASAPRMSIRDWFAVLSDALAMASAIPDSGRINARQVAKVRAIAESI